MFADRFDALLNIAEVSNSQLGRSVNLNSSHIGRLRSGARPLPKKHDYLDAMCRYLTEHLRKDYQVTALQKLTGISSATLANPEDTARYLEQWLTDQEISTSEAAGRFISGFSRFAPAPLPPLADNTPEGTPQKYAEYLFGNAGKRKAVEQFFAMILQEEKPQTLLLFSDENMAWLYEDASFAARWSELFAKVIMKGNRVRIIHTVSRDLNEMIEALIKWIPLYMTGMIEPYCYPRLRDGVFQRTLFIAPQTAAIVSSSVQQQTDGMLNLFLTNRAALDALAAEYERYFVLCRPLMHIYPEQNTEALRNVAESMACAQGDAFLCCATPPLFALPKELVDELSEHAENKGLREQWEQSLSLFKKSVKNQNLSVIILDPKHILPSLGRPHPGSDAALSDKAISAESFFDKGRSGVLPPDETHPGEVLSDETHPGEVLSDALLSDETRPSETLSDTLLSDEAHFGKTPSNDSLSGEVFACGAITYTARHYAIQVEQLKQMERQYDNLSVHFANKLESSAFLYVKEDAGVIVAKVNTPKTAFVINDRNMISAFRDYIESLMLI